MWLHPHRHRRTNDEFTCARVYRCMCVCAGAFKCGMMENTIFVLSVVHAGEDRMFWCAAVPYVQWSKIIPKKDGIRREENGEKRMKKKRIRCYDRHVLKWWIFRLHLVSFKMCAALRLAPHGIYSICCAIYDGRRITDFPFPIFLVLWPPNVTRKQMKNTAVCVYAHCSVLIQSIIRILVCRRLHRFVEIVWKLLS